MHLKDAGALDSFLLRGGAEQHSVSTGKRAARPMLKRRGSWPPWRARSMPSMSSPACRPSWMPGPARRRRQRPSASTPGRCPGQRRQTAKPSCAKLNVSGISRHDVTGVRSTRAATKPVLRISRHHHGNIKSSLITRDFVAGDDYATLAGPPATFAA